MSDLTENSKIIQRVKAVAKTLLPDAEIILYGSRARGDARTDSDWDFLILTDYSVTTELEESVRRAMDQVSLDLGIVISAFLENRYDWSSPIAKASPYHQAIDREGIAV